MFLKSIYMRLVKDTYEDAQTQVKTSIGVTAKIAVTVGILRVTRFLE